MADCREGGIGEWEQEAGGCVGGLGVASSGGFQSAAARHIGAARAPDGGYNAPVTLI